jgi:type IX secretion system PorP/SprF family membrane protein
MTGMLKLCTYISFALLLLSGINASAQADISMATHWNNRASYNPAFIARTDYLYLFANTRRQWIGIDGAPVVYNIQASEYINKLHSAFGISLVSDKVGVTRSFNPMLTYAYRIAKKNGWAFSMGLSGGIFDRTIDGSKLDAETATDPSLVYYYNKVKTLQPDVNVGFEFQNKHFIYGVSSTHLLSVGKSDSLYMNTNHRYAYAVYKNNENESFSYSLGTQVVNRYNLTMVEGNFTFRVKHLERVISRTVKGAQEVLDCGLTFRTSREMTFLCGVMLTPYMRVGYAYDQSLLSKYCRNGTHEIMIEYRIPSKSASTVTRCGGKEFWYR